MSFRKIINGSAVNKGDTTSADVSTIVDATIAQLVDSAPSTLDTLNELAAALNDDANFATTVTNSIAGKQDVVSGVSSTEIGYLDGVTSAIQTQIDNKASLTQTVDAKTGAYTLQLSDRGKVLTCDGTFTISLPDNVFAAGDRVDVVNIGSGTITFGGAATINSVDNKVTINKAYGAATVLYRTENKAILIGNLA